MYSKYIIISFYRVSINQYTSHYTQAIQDVVWSQQTRQGHRGSKLHGPTLMFTSYSIPNPHFSFPCITGIDVGTTKALKKKGWNHWRSILYHHHPIHPLILSIHSSSSILTIMSHGSMKWQGNTHGHHSCALRPPQTGMDELHRRVSLDCHECLLRACTRFLDSVWRRIKK